jgi:sortase A
MPDTTGPVLVTKGAAEYYTKPGLHSRNVTRRIGRVSRTLRGLKRVQLILICIGIAALGYYSYTLSDQVIYQAYQNWAFDQKISGRSNVDFADYLRERTPFGFLVGSAIRSPAPPQPVRAVTSEPGEASAESLPPEGSILGRVVIPRLKLSAVVREGADAKTLSIAVGHVPSTSLPGRTGNFAIAAHRDTLFRALKDIQKDDLVTFEAANGRYTYQVMATTIVRPSDVSVLRADGGALIPAQYLGGTAQPKLLTMITCYPFRYVGSAPKRFIVEARLIQEDSPAKPEAHMAEKANLVAPPEPAPPARPEPNQPVLTKSKAGRSTSVAKPRSQRGFSASVKSAGKHPSKKLAPQKPARKSLRHKAFHKA